MEQLPTWLQRQYDTLVQAFGAREAKSFSWDEAIAALSIPQGTAADVLSRLERFGYLFKEVDTIDQRMRSYRLVEMTQARRLDEQLETWRHTAARTAPPLVQAIDRFWSRCRAILGARADLSATPQQPGRLTVECAAGKAKISNVRIARAVNLESLGKEDQTHAGEILKLFDASSNAYRSVTNVLLEYEKLHRDLSAGVYDLSIGDYVAVDGVPIRLPKKVPNKSLCPICRRFQQSHTALALITGNPKMDSVFQTYRSGQATRTSMQICGYCFTAGWVDLPAALITKEGQSVSKRREYLFITTPLARDDVQRLVDVISKRDLAATVAEEEETEGVSTTEKPAEEGEMAEEELEEEDLSPIAFSQFLKEKYGVEGFDNLAVLGLSTRRLHELRGFVLPSANPLQRVVAVRVPVERLVGEDKVSGAVQRELVKATMYDFWQITGGSLHYNRIVTDVPFSVEGQSIELEDMRRANVAYRIANRYARTGRYRQLNSVLFMLLLSRPREAADQILRTRRREQGGRYAPKSGQVEEVIEMVEGIAQQDDWKFQLGLRIAELLVSIDLAPRAGGFWYKDKATGAFKPYSGVDLVKWIQRIKMVRDPDSVRAWGTSLINGYRREHDGEGPNTQVVSQILTLVEDIIQTCQAQNYPLKDFARDIANMDYYLLFYYNQRQAAQSENKEEVK